MRKILTNKEMAEAFGGYDFRTPDMRKVCQVQRELTLKEINSKMHLEQCDPGVMPYFCDYYWIDRIEWQLIFTQ